MRPDVHSLIRPPEHAETIQKYNKAGLTSSIYFVKWS